MTGMVAIISHDRNLSVTEAEISALASAYESLRGRGRRNYADAGNYVRMVKISTADQSGIEAVDSSWAASTGVVHHQGSLVGARVDQLDGQFGLISYDAETDHLLVATDPFGMQTMYVAERGGKTYVSTSALVLAKYLRAKPSRFGLYAFLRAGYHFGNMTHWQGIERLEPGTCVRFTQTGRERQTYWRPMVDEAVARFGFAQAVDHCTEVAIETCRMYLAAQPRTWSELTGGYDSRLLNLILHKAGVDFFTCTRGDEQDEEVRIAKQVAETKGWDWRCFSIPHDWEQQLLQLFPIALAWGDAHLDILHLSQVQWHHDQRARTYPGLIGGGGGELLRNFAWQQELLNIGKSNRVNLDNWIDMRLLHPMKTSLLAHDPTKEVREDFRNRMVAWAEPYASELNTTQLDIMYAYKGTGHFGAFGSAAGASLHWQWPFFFKPIFTAAISMNYRYRNHHRLMRNIIERLDQRVAAIPTTWGGPAQPQRLTNFHRFLPYYADVGQRAINKLSEKVLGRGLLAQVEPFDPRIAAGRRILLYHLGTRDDNHLKHADMRSAPLFRRETLDKFFIEALDPDFQDTALLGRILTVELALRVADATLDG